MDYSQPGAANDDFFASYFVADNEFDAPLEDPTVSPAFLSDTDPNNLASNNSTVPPTPSLIYDQSMLLSLQNTQLQSDLDDFINIQEPSSAGAAIPPYPYLSLDPQMPIDEETWAELSGFGGLSLNAGITQFSSQQQVPYGPGLSPDAQATNTYGYSSSALLNYRPSTTPVIPPSPTPLPRISGRHLRTVSSGSMSSNGSSLATNVSWYPPASLYQNTHDHISPSSTGMSSASSSFMGSSSSSGIMPSDNYWRSMSSPDISSNLPHVLSPRPTLAHDNYPSTSATSMQQQQPLLQRAAVSAPPVPAAAAAAATSFSSSGFNFIYPTNPPRNLTPNYNGHRIPSSSSASPMYSSPSSPYPVNDEDARAQSPDLYSLFSSQLAGPQAQLDVGLDFRFPTIPPRRNLTPNYYGHGMPSSSSASPMYSSPSSPYSVNDEQDTRAQSLDPYSLFNSQLAGSQAQPHEAGVGFPPIDEIHNRKRSIPTDPDLPSSTEEQQPAAKRQRLFRFHDVTEGKSKLESLACLTCHGRKVKCDAPPMGTENRTCLKCKKRKIKCIWPEKNNRGTYERPRSRYA